MTRESGDRAAFLDLLRARAARTPPVAHSPHPAPAPDHRAPAIRFRSLDTIDDEPPDLYDVFAAAATSQHATVQRLSARSYSTSWLEQLVAAHDIKRAVVSHDPEGRDIGALLEALGVQVSTDTRPATVAGADLGVTSAVAAIAATGSVAVDCSVSGTRTVSLLPRVHLCVLPIDRLVAAPGDFLRSLGEPGHPLPSNLVLISGPSRTGDIEQLMTLGVHGPVAMHVVFTDREVVPHP